MISGSEKIVSVIIPTYNRVSSLRRTIESLKAQSFPSGKFEIIVADDGSKDGTAEYLAEEEKNGTLRFLHMENRGHPAARNAALRISSGEIVVFTDDDCELPKDWIARFDRLFSATDADAIGGAGMGMSTIRVLVEEMGGQMKPIQNVKLDDDIFETTIAFTIPRSASPRGHRPCRSPRARADPTAAG